MPLDNALPVGHEDIFVSYAREDQDAAQHVVTVLQERGYSVFSDNEIRVGDNWDQTLEEKLTAAKCIAVLWSKNAAGSPWVRDEANHGKIKQRLAAAQLDDDRPKGALAKIQMANMRDWQTDPRAKGLWELIEKIDELVARPSAFDVNLAQNQKLRDARRLRETMNSVSNRTEDFAAICHALPGVDPAILKMVEDGYEEMQVAHERFLKEAREDAPVPHFKAAASHFDAALKALGKEADREARDNRTIRYFLTMEMANCLVAGDPQRGDDHTRAISEYKKLSRRGYYPNDVPVHYRLGSALTRMGRDPASVLIAIKALGKANDLCSETTSVLVQQEGTWVKSEILRKLGVCNYFLSEMAINDQNARQRYLRESIELTAKAASFEIPDDDPDYLHLLAVLQAAANFVFLLALRVRDGHPERTDIQDIRRWIGFIRDERIWQIAENQLNMIDSVAMAAVTIGDWNTALVAAERNVSLFAHYAIPNGLNGEERAMEARAKEIAFIAKAALQGGWTFRG